MASAYSISKGKKASESTKLTAYIYTAPGPTERLCVAPNVTDGVDQRISDLQNESAPSTCIFLHLRTARSFPPGLVTPTSIEISTFETSTTFLALWSSGTILASGYSLSLSTQTCERSRVQSPAEP
ncbi:hypothetical protein VTL71DRAFT_3344 [Oculimacula yallundae]|uniref:Uncharacterized protein n=1 Tax=Oculimacula yallundae TaxID=86028 RepID=A0ABR4C8T0_9HELO